ncbi:hypothetical protein ACLOJK_015251 [Asimina triloba]
MRWDAFEAKVVWAAWRLKEKGGLGASSSPNPKETDTDSDAWRDFDCHQNPLFVPPPPRAARAAGMLHSPRFFPPSFSHDTAAAAATTTRDFSNFKLYSHLNPIVSSHQSSQFHNPRRTRRQNDGLVSSSSPPPPPPLELEKDTTEKSRMRSGFQSHSLPRSNTISPPPTKSSQPPAGNKKRPPQATTLSSFFQDVQRQGDVEKALDIWVGKLSPKEQTIILKGQRDWSSALRVFHWFKSQTDYVPNVIHYNVILRILGRAEKWDELRLCWIEMAKDSVIPTNNTYGMLVDVYGKAGLVKEAILWLKHMKVRGIFPDEVTMNTVVRVLKDAGEFDRADRFYKDWCSGRVELDGLDFDSAALEPGWNPISPKHFLLTELFKAGGRGPPKKVPSLDQEGLLRKPQLAATYNTLIDLYGKAGRLKDASDAFSEMLRYGVAPDTITFNTMINICRSHGQITEAESLLNKMEERGVYPDTKSFNIFLSLYGDMGDIDGVLRCYRKIKEAGLHPDTVTYRAVLHILCEKNMIQEVEYVIVEMEKSGACVDEQSLPVIMKMYVNEGLLDLAKVFLEKCCSGRQISSRTYAAIIDSYAEKGLWAEAEAVFFGKGDLGHKKDVTEYNVMIKAYGKADLYDKALSLFGTMRFNGIWPDECTYNSLIQMLSGGELIDGARDLLAKMQEAGFKPRCETFSAVIASNVRLGKTTDAVDVYEEMMRVGVKPNEVVYGCLINAFAESGDAEEALYYLNTMENFGLTANRIIYTSLIKAYGKLGCWEEARELYAKIKDLDGGPDVVASNCMIDVYGELGMVSEAEAIFYSLRQNGCADDVSFAIMIHIYKSMGRLDKAVDVAQEMQKSGLLTDCASFSIVMASYAANRQLIECGELLHKMVTHGILPDATIFKVMFVVIKKGGMPTEAIEQLEKIYEDEKPYSGQAIITSVFSVLEFHAWALESCETLTSAEDLDTSAYNVAIYAYGASGNVDKALNIFMKMREKGLKPDLVTHIHLVDCYGKAGLVEGVKRIHSQMGYGDIEPSESLFEAIIAAYRNMGRNELAGLTLQQMESSFYSEDDEDSDISEDDEDDERSNFSEADEDDERSDLSDEEDHHDSDDEGSVGLSD